MIKKTSILKSNFIGVYARAWDDIVLLPANVEKEEAAEFEETLGAQSRKLFIDNSSLIGTMTVMNSHGIILPGSANREDFKNGFNGRNVLFLDDKINAIGNDIIANDNAAIIHKDFNNSSRKLIEDTLGVEVIKATIGGIKTVGSAGVVTGKGMLVAPEASDEEVEFLSKYFKVQAKAGTANFGNMYIGSSIVANTKGVLVGRDTTPIEMGRIDDILS
jgi:translation initiation factor 6